MNGKPITSEIRLDHITKPMFNFTWEITYGTSATASCWRWPLFAIIRRTSYDNLSCKLYGVRALLRGFAKVELEAILVFKVVWSS